MTQGSPATATGGEVEPELNTHHGRGHDLLGSNRGSVAHSLVVVGWLGVAGIIADDELAAEQNGVVDGDEATGGKVGHALRWRVAGSVASKAVWLGASNARATTRGRHTTATATPRLPWRRQLRAKRAATRGWRW